MVLASISCKKDYLNVQPEDRITSVSFWKTESDVSLALNGIYSVLRHRGIYGSGPTLDACTPDAFQWAHWNGKEEQIGNGSITPGDDGLLLDRWTMCYQIISRANYFLANYEKVTTLSSESKATYTGEVHFMRGIAYALLAETYGGGPIIKSVIGVDEARTLTRATLQENWDQAIADYDTAIANLKDVAPMVGRATKGAALGLKMRAYLYQNKYTDVLKMVQQIDALGKYSLFPSYKGLFELENENNKEVLFDIQYVGGPQEQGNFFAWLALPQNSASGASDPAPTQNIVDAYEMIDGSAVDPANPYKGRDPRLDFTILRPGAMFEGKLYPVDIKNHTGQRVGFGLRKNVGENVPITTTRMSPLNFIVLRYADVLLSKAEALIETYQNISEAIGIINRIRTERTDVKIKVLLTNLTQAQARDALRHERRIEFFGEGINWTDIKRWNLGPQIYPVKVFAADGSLVETKFPGGYKAKDNLLPIPDNERSINTNLKQNPGW
jgi:hypothetical protein